MKKQSTAMLLIMLTAGALLFAVRSTQEQIQFEKALLLEEVEGRLKEAIALYRTIADSENNEALAAHAQLRIGICFERLGREEAAIAYQTVIDRYPSHAAIADQARSRLSALQKATTTDLVARKVWTDPPDFSGSVSPDGLYLSFPDWETGNLGIYQLATGKSRNITSDGSWENDTYNYAETSHWSPDGKQLIYTRFYQGSYELRIVGLDGKPARLLYRNPDVWGPYEGGWSPDGKHVSLTLARNDGTHQLGILTVADGSVRILKSTDWRWPTAGPFSPDGRFFAYTLPGEDSPNRDIFLMAPDGSRQMHLIEHPADEEVLGWTPDGSLLFRSNRTGNSGLWMIAVQNGEARGLPRLIQPNLGDVIPMGSTKTGDLYYGVSGGGGWDAVLASFDPESGVVTGPPRRISEQRLARNSSPDWSPDGKRLAYVSRRGRTQIVVIRSLESSGQERELVPPFQILGVRWFPDGQSLLVTGQRRTKSAAYRVNVEGGGQTAEPSAQPMRFSPEHLVDIIFGNRTRSGLPVVAPDGSAIYYLKLKDALEGSTTRRTVVGIARFDLTSGEDTLLYRWVQGHVRPFFAVSPDSRRIAFKAGPQDEGEVLMMMSADGGETRQLASLRYQGKPIRSIQSQATLAWSPDGRFLVFSGSPELDGVLTEWLWRVAATGGSPERLVGGSFDQAGPWGPDGPSRLRQLRFSHDGRQLAMIGRMPPVSPDAVWVLENLSSVTEERK